MKMNVMNVILVPALLLASGCGQPDLSELTPASPDAKHYDRFEVVELDGLNGNRLTVDCGWMDERPIPGHYPLHFRIWKSKDEFTPYSVLIDSTSVLHSVSVVENEGGDFLVFHFALGFDPSRIRHSFSNIVDSTGIYDAQTKQPM